MAHLYRAATWNCQLRTLGRGPRLMGSHRVTYFFFPSLRATHLLGDELNATLTRFIPSMSRIVRGWSLLNAVEAQACVHWSNGVWVCDRHKQGMTYRPKCIRSRQISQSRHKKVKVSDFFYIQRLSSHKWHFTVCDRHIGMPLCEIAVPSGDIWRVGIWEFTKFACRPRLHMFRGASKRSAAVRKTFNPQPKLILIYRPQKDERLSWPEWITYSSSFRVEKVAPPGFEPAIPIQIQKPKTR